MVCGREGRKQPDIQGQVKTISMEGQECFKEFRISKSLEIFSFTLQSCGEAREY